MPITSINSNVSHCHEMKSEQDKFNALLEEVVKLRASQPNYTASSGNFITEKTSNLAKRQLYCLEKINDFTNKFQRNLQLQKRVDQLNSSIIIPDKACARDFIGVTKTAMQMTQELSQNCKTKRLLDKQLMENYKNRANQYSYCDLNNKDFVRFGRSAIDYYTNKENSSKSPVRVTLQVNGGECEEFGDCTINSIVNENVVASSPLL